MANLILLRHGSTSLNKKSSDDGAGRIRGWVDVPLDKKGQHEAVALGAKFAHEGISKVYCSELQRARVVGEHIARAAHVPLIETDQLKPWNLGMLHGKEVDKVLPMMKFAVEHPTLVIPDGESFDSYRKRYLPFLAKLLAMSKSSSKPIVAVTHSRNIQLARAWDKKGRPNDFSFDLARMQDYKDEVPPGGQLELKP